MAARMDARCGRGKAGLDALSAVGAQYFGLLADRNGLLLQLQDFAACGVPEVRDAVRACLARMWGTAEDGTGLEPVTVKTFLAYWMLLNADAARDVEQVDAAGAEGVRTRIQSSLFAHITTETNR